MTEANQWTGFYMITASVMKELTEAVIYFMHSSKIEILKICVKFIKKVLSLGLELTVERNH